MNHYSCTNFLIGRKLRREVLGGHEAVCRISGQLTSLFRFPMGLTNPQIAGVVRRADLRPLGWSVRSLDTVLADQKKVLIRLLKVRGGDIVLMHDSGRYAAQAAETLDRALDVLTERKFRFTLPPDFLRSSS
jgi:peptidoglycan/xylan/chitin deacetylase (PgdA/CDA1 family)